VLSETDIRRELEPYAAFKRAYQDGRRGEELPKVVGAASSFSAVLTILVHGPLAVVTGIARRTRAYRLLALLARARIASDRLSYEPQSCGFNAAYTNLGLALLGRGDVAGAIRCLEASWHVHPCAHDVSFGLNQRLAAALEPYPYARPAREQYERISRLFLAY
jgi:hypothetical protein